MKKILPLLLIPVALIGIAATYTITQLTANLNPGNSTLIEVYDPAATPKSGKVLLTNYVRQSQIDTSAEIQAILGSVYQSTNDVLTRVAGIGAGTSGDVLFRDAAGWTNLAKGADNKILKLVGGFPTWQDDQTGGGGGLIGTVLNSVPITNTIFGVDSTGTNALAASEAMVTNALGMDLTATLALKAPLASPTFSGTVTVSGDVNITGNMTNSTTQTDTLYLSSLTETNKLLGLGATTNAMVATAAMITNTWGIFDGTTTKFVSGNGTLQTPAGGSGISFFALSYAGGSPTANTIRFAGAYPVSTPQTAASAAETGLPLLTTATLKSVAITITVGGTLGTAGQYVTNFVTINQSTDIPVWTNAFDSAKIHFVNTNLNTTLNPGDKVCWKLAYPSTWTQTPTSVGVLMVLGIQ